MLVNAAMAMMSVAAVGFYLRFLVALFKEYAHQVSGYWVRLRLSSREDKVVELRTRRQPKTRAA